jgi:hypothetical protein
MPIQCMRIISRGFRWSEIRENMAAIHTLGSPFLLFPAKFFLGFILSYNSFLSLFEITLSQPQLQSVPPNSVNLGLKQSICFRVLLKIRPSPEIISHSHITLVPSFPSGQTIDIHSLSFLCSIAFLPSSIANGPKIFQCQCDLDTIRATDPRG